MARRRGRPGAGRGGGGIQTLDPHRARVATAATAVALAGLLGAIPVAVGSDRRAALASLAVAGVIATLIGLAGRVRAAWWAVATLGAEYAVLIRGQRGLDAWAPVVGVGLLLLAESIQGSIQARPRAPHRAGIGVRRLVDLGLLSFASLAVGSLLIAVGGAAIGAGWVPVIVGMIASCAILVVVLVLAKAGEALSPPGEKVYDGVGDGAPPGSRDPNGLNPEG